MNKRLREIEQRLAAIKQELEAEGADVTALDTETTSLIEERTRIMNEIEKRNQILARVGSFGEDGEPVITEQQRTTFDAESPEYRSAWLKNIRRMDLTAVEQRALTTATNSVGAVVPTQTANKIIDKVKQYAPLLDKIDLFHVKGFLVIPAEGNTTEAAKHSEGATITADKDTVVKVQLAGYEVTKLITISKSVETMSIDVFESWLVNKIARAVADKISGLIINGTGTGEAQGINAISWTEDTNMVTVGATAALTEANVVKAVSLLNGGYDAGAEWLMSKKTFWNDFYPLMDKAKNITITIENGKYYVAGYEVTFDDRMTENEAILGNLYRGYAGNMPEDITVTSQFVTRENSYDFLGAGMFDGKVQATEAFVKIAKGKAA